MVCSTESGPTPGLPCIFPFKLDGVAYHTCKLDEKDGSRWCSTKIDKNGQHLPGNWGNCGSDCGEHIIHCRDSNIYFISQVRTLTFFKVAILCKLHSYSITHSYDMLYNDWTGDHTW